MDTDCNACATEHKNDYGKEIHNFGKLNFKMRCSTHKNIITQEEEKGKRIFNAMTLCEGKNCKILL